MQSAEDRALTLKAAAEQEQRDLFRDFDPIFTPRAANTSMRMTGYMTAATAESTTFQLAGQGQAHMMPTAAAFSPQRIAIIQEAREVCGSQPCFQPQGWLPQTPLAS